MANHQRPIPNNLSKNPQKIRNITEGVIEVIVLFIVFAFIPFTSKMRWICVISIGAFIMVLNVLGVEGNSIIQTLMAKNRYRRLTKKKYSYRRFRDGESRDIAEITRNGKVVSIKNNRGYKYFKSFMGRE